MWSAKRAILAFATLIAACSLAEIGEAATGSKPRDFCAVAQDPAAFAHEGELELSGQLVASIHGAAMTNANCPDRMILFGYGDAGDAFEAAVRLQIACPNAVLTFTMRGRLTQIDGVSNNRVWAIAPTEEITDMLWAAEFACPNTYQSFESRRAP